MQSAGARSIGAAAPSRKHPSNNTPAPDAKKNQKKIHIYTHAALDTPRQTCYIVPRNGWNRYKAFTHGWTTTPAQSGADAASLPKSFFYGQTAPSVKPD